MKVWFQMFWNVLEFRVYQLARWRYWNDQWKETISYNLYISTLTVNAQEIPTHMLINCGATSIAFIDQDFARHHQNTTPGSTGETASRGHWWKTYSIWGHYAYCHSTNDDSGPWRTTTYVRYNVRTLPSCHLDSLDVNSWCCCVVCIQYGHVYITTLHHISSWWTCYCTWSDRRNPGTRLFPVGRR